MGFLGFGKKKQPTIPPEALTLWVHRKSHFEQLRAFAIARGNEPLSFRALGDTFAAAPALMTTEGPISVKGDLLEQLGMNEREAFTTASGNAAEALSTSKALGGLRVWEGPHVEALLLMMPMLRPQLQLPEQVVAMFPAEAVVLVAGVNDDEALGRMLELAEQAYGASQEYRSLKVITWPGDGPAHTQWLPPEGHALRARFVAAAARSRKQEATSAHFVFAKDVAPLAHLAALPAEHGGALVGAWMRDADVVLPRVDRVVLFDTDDQALARVEVSFATLLEALPQAFEVVPIELEALDDEDADDESEDVPEEEDDDEDDLERAELVRTRGALFPTLAERRHLVAREAHLSAQPGATSRVVPGDELLAAWDAGDALLAQAGGPSGTVQLKAPDGRIAEVPLAAFGKRMERRDVQDQLRFAHSFVTHSLVGALFDPDYQAPDLSLLGDVAELRERGATSRPSLMSSNELRAMKKQFTAPEGDELTGEQVTQLLMATSVELSEPSRLFPVVRPPGYAEAQRENELAMVRGSKGEAVDVHHPERISRPGPEGLTFDLVSDAGNQMRPLTRNTLPDSLEETAWRTAQLNLKASSIERPRRAGDGWYEGPWHDDYDAARMLLLPELAARCAVKGDTLVFAPLVGRTWVAGGDDVPALTSVLDAIDAHLASEATTSPYQYRQLLFGWPWVVRAGTVARWAVPPAHPLAARFADLDARLEKRRRQSREHIGGFAQAAYSPMQPKESSA